MGAETLNNTEKMEVRIMTITKEKHEELGKHLKIARRALLKATWILMDSHCPKNFKTRSGDLAGKVKSLCWDLADYAILKRAFYANEAEKLYIGDD